jgi:hypothetical protein
MLWFSGDRFIKAQRGKKHARGAENRKAPDFFAAL